VIIKKQERSFKTKAKAHLRKLCCYDNNQFPSSEHKSMQLTLDIPDQYIQGQTQSQTAQQIKLYAALLMFQSGQLSRGAACEFAGVDIYEFFSACKQHQISAINTTEDSIEADVIRFQQRA
jgi:predicted HTH domain antitoxin